MDRLPRPERYDVSSTVLPGLSKLLEELGEVIQVGGKYLAVDGRAEHWDGDLDEMMADELGDALAAINWFLLHNTDRIDRGRVAERKQSKMGTYERWRRERLSVDCLTCNGSGCEEGCGYRGGCEWAHDGPESHRVCRTCGGRGQVQVDG